MPQKDVVNIALIGAGFMGRTHSNGWGQVSRFFKPPIKPVMHTAFALPEENPQAMAKWGWQNFSTDWQKTVASPDMDRVDIVAPNYMHTPLAKGAVGAGRHVASPGHDNVRSDEIADSAEPTSPVREIIRWLGFDRQAAAAQGIWSLPKRVLSALPTWLGELLCTRRALGQTKRSAASQPKGTYGTRTSRYLQAPDKDGADVPPEAHLASRGAGDRGFRKLLIVLILAAVIAVIGALTYLGATTKNPLVLTPLLPIAVSLLRDLRIMMLSWA